jgi:hemerythrin-like domain-containing protein
MSQEAANKPAVYERVQFMRCFGGKKDVAESASPSCCECRLRYNDINGSKEGRMKATQGLKNEHRGIEQMLRVLSAISGNVGHGEPLHLAHVDGIMEFLTVFIDKCHHGKEEEFLFPTLEAAGVLREGGPIGVLLGEHDEGRRLVSRLKQCIADHRSGDRQAASGIQETVTAYVNLLQQHITKEDTVLFPLADERLDAEQDAILFEEFQRLERERIGVGKHEAFHTLLDELQDKYLK